VNLPSGITGSFIHLSLQAVVNSVWQALILVLFVSLLLRFLKANAAIRYGIWMCALALVLVLPFAGMFRRGGSGPDAPAATRAVAVSADVERTQTEAPFVIPEKLVLFVFASVLLISIIRLSGILRGMLFLKRLRNESRPASAGLLMRFQELLAVCSMRRSVTLRVSPDIEGPLSLGFTNPVILIPQKMMQEFAPEELDRILIHELAHMDRVDDWTKLFQKIAEAIFFFDPAVLWIGKKLDLEREIACDDMVVLRTGSARVYAGCLARLVEFAGWSNAAACAPAALLTKSQFCRRIDMLLDKKQNRSLHVSKGMVALMLVSLVILFVLFTQVSPLVAISQREAGEKNMRMAEQKMQQAEEQIWASADQKMRARDEASRAEAERKLQLSKEAMERARDRKSTRLNSSH